MTAVDVSASNISGFGAVQLVGSLLPALEANPGATIGTLILPERGPIAAYTRRSAGPVRRYRRHLPNALSRILECLWLGRRLSDGPPLLVLGDLPLRRRGRQVVLIHTAHLIPGATTSSWLASVKYAVSRCLFRLNIGFVSHAIVQSEAMRHALEAAYPRLAGRVAVIPQPPPEWLLGAPCREPRANDGALRLFYPAAGYPHKNHALLHAFVREGRHDPWGASFDLTIGGAAEGAIRGWGTLAPESMLARYAEADALVFPSLAESYGLPLVEAMYLGLPIVCADRPYARSLCGDDALYFDPRSTESLAAALAELKARLGTGWRPDWSDRLGAVPKDWGEVAARMLALCGDDAPSGR
ncbi:MAG TPA: glycosyltransferase [Allosphingosinicella sp.]|nr:glycosyltransferase [Allosphingosinicella sp.]